MPASDLRDGTGVDLGRLVAEIDWTVEHESLRCRRAELIALDLRSRGEVGRRATVAVAALAGLPVVSESDERPGHEVGFILEVGVRVRGT